jgi:hypothetical protein
LLSDTFEFQETDALLPLPFYFQLYQGLNAAYDVIFLYQLQISHYKKALFNTHFIPSASVMHLAKATQDVYGQLDSPPLAAVDDDAGKPPTAGDGGVGDGGGLLELE